MKLLKSKGVRSTRWKITDKMFLSLTMTATIIEFSEVGASFIDGLITSNCLGSDAMAAIGIINPIYSILGVISGLIAVGMQIRCTDEIGRGNVQNMNRFFSASIFVSSIISVLAAILLMLFSRPFAVFLGANGNAASLLDDVADYAFGLGLGVPAIILTSVLAPALQLDSGGKIIRIGAIISAVSNIAFDLVAVRLNAGVRGIAFATSASFYLNLLWQCTHFLKKNRMLRFVRPDVSFAEFWKMLINGSEKAVRRTANIIRPIILNMIIISYGGTIAMSALSIHNNFSGFAEIILSGIAEAVVLLTSLYYGEVNEDAITEVNRCAHHAIFRTSGLICVLLLVFAGPIASLYAPPEGELKEMAVFAIRMLALENPLIALINSRIKYLQAIQRKLNMNLLIFASRLIFILLCAWILGSLFGVYGILSCFACSDALTLIAITVFYQIKCKKSRPTLQDFMSLPEEFKVSPQDVISLHVRNMEDVSLTAEQISLFCKGHRFSPRVCNRMTLVFEELSNNIVTHGFPMNQSHEPIIDVRLVAREKRLVLRLRDNCPRFDILKKIAEVNKEDADPTRNIGIRITGKCAKDIRYVNAFETNNIIIEYEDT